MANRPALTLRGAFVLTALAVAILLALLFQRIFAVTREAILQGAETLRREMTVRISGRVEQHRQQALGALEDVERQIRHGAVHCDDLVSLEASLFARVLNNENLAEATLTRAASQGYDDDGYMRVAPDPKWQLSVFRVLEGGGRILSRRIVPAGGAFVVELRDRPASGGFPGPPFVKAPISGEDPAAHLTFRTTTSTRNYGRAIWSDLHWSEQDGQLPEAQRRVEVTVQKAIEDGKGGFLGVLRVGLLTQQLDEVTRLGGAEHRVFISDEQGRLVTRLAPEDRIEEAGDDLRVAPASLPPEVALALKLPVLARVVREKVGGSGEVEVGGRKFLATFSPLGNWWAVGIVAPEDHYLGSLVRTRQRLLVTSVLVMGGILALGAAALRILRGGLGEIVDATARLRNFDFAAAETRSPFRDVQEVMGGVELAKTAMRAMGKYVPVDLVRHLYQTRREPMLGGELLDVSLMFTDIKDFTSLSERLSPDELARALGRYLEAMTGAIHAEQGTIDKYIGDAIMAVWNAPRPCPDHSERACRAALACLEAGGALYASPAWDGLPPLATRFGLHRAEVMVGHYGAPDRMSFTALGDGVNLASRLEGLNKEYGTTILVSEAVHDAAGESFEFRFLDRVAVKGKTQGVRVYELRGTKDAPDAGRATARAYETAWLAFSRREFAAALAIFESQLADPPSRVMAERCRRLMAEPPPPDWDGIYVATSK